MDPKRVLIRRCKFEQCYGVALKGQNDCQSVAHVDQFGHPSFVFLGDVPQDWRPRPLDS